MTAGLSSVAGRLVLPDRVMPGRVEIEDGLIVSVESDEAAADGPYIVPGFIDVHVHGWGGHDAMGGEAALDGMARALLGRGVTSFLPTAVTASIPALQAFAAVVRRWSPAAPADGAEPVGFNIEGPFISGQRAGAQNPSFIRMPDDVPRAELEPLVDGLRLMTVAPELPGALELIAWLRERHVGVSSGHSAATVDEARAGYRAGAGTTTHLFNAMTGIDHRAPGLAVAALVDDDAYVELIADGHHVDPSVWPIVIRTKPPERLLLVSDALALAGMGDGRAWVGGLEVEVREGRCTLVASQTLAGSVIALDSAVRNLVRSGVPIPAAAAAASTNPAALLGIADRGRIVVGQRAHLVELDDDLQVRRVMRSQDWQPGASGRA